jgi:hypothetical protein
MSRRDDLVRLLHAAYLAGFKASGEGWNGEYPFGQNGTDMEADEYYKQRRDKAIEALIAQEDAAQKGDGE